MKKILSPWLLVRLCLLTVVWGGAVFGSASVVNQVVQSRLPGFESFIKGYVVTYQQALLASGRDLDQLLDDGRLQAGMAKAAGIADPAVRRVLYEYRYLHPDNTVSFYDRGRDISVQAEGSTVIQPDERILSRIGRDGLAAWLLGNPRQPLLVVARRVQNTAAGVQIFALLVRPLSASLADFGLPAMQNQAFQVTLASRVGGQVWRLAADGHGHADGSLAALDLARPHLVTGTGKVVIVRPLPGVPGWAVVIEMPLQVVASTVSRLRGLLLTLAAVVSVLLFWQPRLHHWRRVARGAQAVHARAGAAAGPLRQAMRRTMEGDALAEPGEYDRATAPVFHSFNRPPPRHAATSGAGTGGAPAHAAARLPRPVIPAAEAPRMKPRLPEETVRDLVQKAIGADALLLAYQPIYHAGDGVPVLHEVYVRLPGPEGQPPLEAHEFLGQAAALGLLPKLDMQVFGKVMNTHFAAGEGPATPLALNLAGHSMESIAYVEALLGHGNPAALSRLVLEVRSSELMQDPKAMGFLKQCQARGVKLAVDYFGGGKAMLEATRSLGFDYVKLDVLKFWYDLDRRKEMVGLSRVATNIGLPVILEKIESIQMEVMGRRLGIPYLQGYHLRRPDAGLTTAPLPGWRAAAGSPPSEPPSAPATPSATAS
jgi:EAL domain-containing protein (putative c-di-GMP-specific phosphodiesterase class I)